jgi:hypothetical protein
MDVEAPALADFARYRVEPGESFTLPDHDPADTGALDGAEEIEPEYRNYVVAQVPAGTLSAMSPRFPEPPADVRRFAERELESAG